MARFLTIFLTVDLEMPSKVLCAFGYILILAQITILIHRAKLVDELSGTNLTSKILLQIIPIVIYQKNNDVAVIDIFLRSDLLLILSDSLLLVLQ